MVAADQVPPGVQYGCCHDDAAPQQVRDVTVRDVTPYVIHTVGRTQEDATKHLSHSTEIVTSWHALPISPLVFCVTFDLC